jgi:cold-inducible RNA-binding protein
MPCPKLIGTPTDSARNRSREPLGLLPTLTERNITMSNKLFVGNLSFDTTSDEIRDLFSEVGPVESCQVITDRDTGRSKGFGFVEMNSREGADAAKDKFDGKDLHGRPLKVNEAKPKSISRNNGEGFGSRSY